MGKNLEQKEKQAPRFGVLDAVIVLLIVCLIAGIYFRSNVIDFITTKRNIRDYTITFAVDNIRYTTPHFISIGDEVVMEENGKPLGTIIEESEGNSKIALSITPASEIFTDNGEVIEVFYPNNESRVNVKGRLQCRGTYSEDGGFLVNGSTYLSAGQTIAVHTENVSMELRVLQIEAME